MVVEINEQIRSYPEAEKFLYGGECPAKVCRTFDSCCQDPDSIVLLSWQEMAAIAGCEVINPTTGYCCHFLPA